MDPSKKNSRRGSTREPFAESPTRRIAANRQGQIAIVPIDSHCGRTDMRQIVGRKMSKSSEKNALRFAAGSILLDHPPRRKLAVRHAGCPRNLRILRENRLSLIRDFFGAGSKPFIAPRVTAQIARVSATRNAISFEKIAPRSQTGGRIMSHSHPPHNSRRRGSHRQLAGRRLCWEPIPEPPRTVPSGDPTVHKYHETDESAR